MKCAGHVMKNCNEMCWACNEKLQWNEQGMEWKIAMKCAGYVMKNCNEIPSDTFEKSQWNLLSI